MPTILTAKERDTVLEKSETFLHREIGVGFLDWLGIIGRAYWFLISKYLVRENDSSRNNTK